jgi:hypothetical protein
LFHSGQQGLLRVAHSGGCTKYHLLGGCVAYLKNGEYGKGCDLTNAWLCENKLSYAAVSCCWIVWNIETIGYLGAVVVVLFSVVLRF